MIGNFHEWEVEGIFDGNEVAHWLNKNINLCLGCAAIYLSAIFTGQKYMKNQPR